MTRQTPFVASKVELDPTGRPAAVRALVELARAYMQPRYDLWKTWYDFRQGDQWTKTQHKQRPVLNFLYTNYFQAKALLTEAVPDPRYEPRALNQRGKAMAMQSFWETIRDQSRYPWQLTEAVGNAYTYGTGWLRRRWDPYLADGMGDMRIESVSPWLVLCEPEAKCPDAAMWWAVESPVSRRRVEGIYGKISDEVWTHCLAGREGLMGPLARPTGGAGDEFAVALEIWLLDGRLDEENLSDKVEEQPFGAAARYLKVLGDCTLHDALSIYGPRSTLTRIVLDPIEDEVWGRSRIEQILGPQRMVNSRFWAAARAMDNAAFPDKIVDIEANVREKVTTQPGKIYHKSAAGEIHWERGPGPHPQEMDLLSAGIGLMDRLSMVQAGLQGVRPTGVSSGVAISQLQTAAMSGIRLQIRQLAEAIQEMGAALPRDLEKFYLLPRPVSIEGTDLLVDGRALAGPWQVKVDTRPMLSGDTLGEYEMLNRIVERLGVPPDVLIEKAPFLSDVQKAELKQRMELMYRTAAAQSEAEAVPEEAAA